MAPELRVYLHNIYGNHAGWNDRARGLRTGIREIDPDLMLFKEAIANDMHDQVREIVPEGMTILHAGFRHADGTGISVASRWPVVPVEEIDLRLPERSGDAPCTAMLVTIQAPDPIGPVLLVHHFPNYHPAHEWERTEQAWRVAMAVEERVAHAPMHVVFGGDLDAEPEAESLCFLTGRQTLHGTSVCYRNAWESRHPGTRVETFTPANPLMRETTRDWPFRWIDHILVRCGDDGRPTLAVADARLAFTEPVDGVMVSDHYGLVVDQVPQEPTVDDHGAYG